MQSKIIHFLKSAKGYISGEEISRHLKISRAAIWKYMQELRKNGYDIVAVPHLGYKLVSCPDMLLPQEIQHKLKTKFIGKKIVHFDSTGSTMDVAFQMGIDGAEEGTVVCAEGQTKGKGRLGRSWSSPKGKGIYMSIILRPQVSPTDVAKCTLLSAVAVCDAVKETTGLTVNIKWPNDVLVGKKKLAGILTELSAEMDRVRFIVIGMGINVNTPVSLLPENSTSLKNELKNSVSRIVLMQNILCSLENWYNIFLLQGHLPITQKWKEYSSTLGKRIRIVDPSGSVEGEALDLDENGGLLIRSDSGITVKKMTGDVVQIR